MAIIAANVATRPRSRFLFDRPELIGPLFIAPAILYVVSLVALPFSSPSTTASVLSRLSIQVIGSLVWTISPT
jgi:hypothetical protein